jgi:hypothetical protein
MAPARRANHESPNEEAKNHFSLRLHSESNHLNPELFFYGVSQESSATKLHDLGEEPRSIPDLPRQI